MRKLVRPLTLSAMLISFSKVFVLSRGAAALNNGMNESLTLSTRHTSSVGISIAPVDHRLYMRIFDDEDEIGPNDCLMVAINMMADLGLLGWNSKILHRFRS